MNIYEAYLAVKENKIIRANVDDSVYYIVQVNHSPFEDCDIVKIDLDDNASESKPPKNFHSLSYEDLKEVCIPCFENESEYKIVTPEQVFEEIYKKWKKENE